MKAVVHICRHLYIHKLSFILPQNPYLQSSSSLHAWLAVLVMAIYGAGIAT